MPARGGDVHVESEYGQGTTFIVRLPADANETVGIDSLPRAPLELAIDDPMETVPSRDPETILVIDG